MERFSLSFHQKRPTSKAFTLVELLVVIALVSLLATWTLMSSSDNSQTVATDARDRILNDIVMFKKLSLLEKNDNGFITFTGSGSGFWATYPSHTIYTLSLQSITTPDEGKTWTFTVQTGSGSQLFPLNESGMELNYRDSSNTIRTLSITSEREGLSSFTLPQTNNPLDQYFNVYFQDTEQLQNKSNEVAFMFFTPRNYNDTPDDDIVMKLFDDQNPAQELSSAKAIFDSYGRMHWQTYLSSTGNQETPAPSKVNVQLFKRSDPSKILISFSLPADY